MSLTGVGIGEVPLHSIRMIRVLPWARNKNHGVSLSSAMKSLFFEWDRRGWGRLTSDHAL